MIKCTLLLIISIVCQLPVLAQVNPVEQQITKFLARSDQAFAKNNLDASCKLLDKALLISDSARLFKYSIMICVDYANIETQRNRQAKALQLLTKATTYSNQFKDKSVRRKFMIYHASAETYYSITRLDSANYYFNQCANLINAYPDSLKSFNFYMNLYYLSRSYLAQETMAFHESISLNQEAIRRYNIKYKTSDGSGNTLNSLAKSYLALGQFARADSAFRQSARMFAPNPLFQAIILCNLIDSKLQQNQAKAARTVLTQAQRAYQTYFRQTPQPDTDVERRLKQALAGVLLAEGNLSAAKAAFADLLTFSQKHFTMPSAFRVDAHLSLSRLHQHEGNTAAGRQALDAAVREAYGPRARSWQQAILPRSLITALTQKAAFLSTAPASTTAIRRTNAQEALLAYEQAIDLVTSLRRGALLPESKAFLAQKSAGLYGPALGLCYELAQQPGAAQQFQQRAFALFDKQQNSLLADSQLEQQLVRQFLPPFLQTEFRTLNQRLSQLRLVREGSSNATLEAELNKTERSLIEWQQRVASDYPAYGQSLRKIIQLSIVEYRQHLSAGEVLLCYAPTPSGLLVLTLDRETCSFRRIPVAPESLNRAIANYRAEISRDPGIVGLYDNRPARRLHQLVLTPIQDQIRAATAITVVAPPNWQIPFEALENRAGRMLIQETEVGYQFNLSGRLVPTESRPAKHQSLTMAPFGADTGQGPFRMATGHLLPPLRASAREASLLGGLNWLGRSASKQRFLIDAPNAQQVLLTTHTYAGERETALVFHPSKPDESTYLLYPSELQHVDLRALEFAGLSACATEKGIQVVGDGVHSLGRAMAWAGARSVTCSWFPINDKAQALMASYFYPKLTNGKSVRENLRQARLDFLASAEGKRYSGHPFYWASTALYGGHNILSTNIIWPKSQPWAIGLGLFTCFLGLVGWVFFRQKSLPRTNGF